MENPKPEKVAVVEEVREKFTDSDAALLTEYRGLTVRDLAELRASMREAGGDYRVYKNTLVRRATKELDLDFDDQLVGPTAIAFVGNKPDGTPGDAVLVAKALKTFAKANPLLVIKGGLLGTHVLDATSVKALADVAPREELLSRLAGGIAAPMREFASLLQAVPAKFAYGLQALIEAGGASGAPADASPAVADDAETSTDSTTEDAPADSTDADATEDTAAAEPAAEDNTTVADAAADETPAADAAVEEE